MSGSADEGWAASPGIDPSPAEHEAASTLEVDGEVFELRPDGSGGTHYSWVSGPNPGYGFGVSPTTGDAEATEATGATGATDEHRGHVRAFLAMIDPATGYVADD